MQKYNLNDLVQDLESVAEQIKESVEEKCLACLEIDYYNLKGLVKYLEELIEEEKGKKMSKYTYLDYEGNIVSENGLEDNILYAEEFNTILNSDYDYMVNLLVHDSRVVEDLENIFSDLGLAFGKEEGCFNWSMRFTVWLNKKGSKQVIQDIKDVFTLWWAIGDTLEFGSVEHDRLENITLDDIKKLVGKITELGER